MYSHTGAGTWQTNLRQILRANGLDSELVAIPPIEELGAYTERVAPAWCITEACSNPEVYINTLSRAC